MTGVEPLIEALHARDVERARELIEAESELIDAVAADGDTPLMAAIDARHAEAVDLLLARGAAVDLFTAAALGDLTRIAKLMDDGDPRRFRFNQQGWTALHLAARYGQTAAVRTLLDKGAYLPQLSATHVTNSPLHEALTNGHRETAELLIERGSRVDTTDARTWSAMHMAVASANPAVVELLLECSAPIDERRSNGQTPLAMAIELGADDLANLLREHGASLE